MFTTVMLLAVKHAIACTSGLLSGGIDADICLPDTIVTVPFICLPLQIVIAYQGRCVSSIGS